MQTFLPYPNFKACAQTLDTKRLGKQRVEAKQILNALERRRTGAGGGWVNHPAVLMWEGYEEALKVYYNTMVAEWKGRGYNNTMELQPVDMLMIVDPPWLGDDRLHSSHRSNLLRKDPEYYGVFRWKEGPDQAYYWPVRR